MNNENIDLLEMIDAFIGSNTIESKNILFNKIKDNIDNLNFKKDYLEDYIIRKKQIILKHLEAFSKNGNIEEIEKAKTVIKEISNY
jgi:hypothetical protein